MSKMTSHRASGGYKTTSGICRACECTRKAVAREICLMGKNLPRNMLSISAVASTGLTMPYWTTMIHGRVRFKAAGTRMRVEENHALHVSIWRKRKISC